MHLDQSAIIVENYKLKFASPYDFIKSLKQTVNHNLKLNNTGLNFDFDIKDKDNKSIVNNQYWYNGKNVFKIYASGFKKPLLKFTVFHINYKLWYRYQLIGLAGKPTNDRQILLQAIEEILSQYLIAQNSSINILPLPKNQKPSTKEAIVIKAKYVMIPFGIVFTVSLLTHIALWPFFIGFLCFTGLTYIVFVFSSIGD